MGGLLRIEPRIVPSVPKECACKCAFGPKVCLRSRRFTLPSVPDAFVSKDCAFGTRGMCFGTEGLILRYWIRRLCAAVVKVLCSLCLWEEGVGLASGVCSLPRWCVCVALCLGVSFGSCCRCWLRVVLMCFQLVQLSCLASGDSALWRGIWRRPVPSSRAGGDVWCCMRAVGCLGASFVWVGTSEPLMLAYMHQSTWVGKVEGGLGRASCRLVRRAVRQTRVDTWREASEHRARATWASMLLCARSKVTDLFLLSRNLRCAY